MCVLQPAFVHSQRIYVPVLVEGDGPLHGEHRLRVVIRSGLKYQGQAVCLYVHLGFRSKCLRKVLKTYEDVLMHVCVFPHLMEQRTVSDGNTQGTEAPAQHHVIRGIVTVAAATTGNQPGHCRPAEHHPAHTHTTRRRSFCSCTYFTVTLVKPSQQHTSCPTSHRNPSVPQPHPPPPVM